MCKIRQFIKKMNNYMTIMSYNYYGIIKGISGPIIIPYYISYRLIQTEPKTILGAFFISSTLAYFYTYFYAYFIKKFKMAKGVVKGGPARSPVSIMSYNYYGIIKGISGPIIIPYYIPYKRFKWK
jgi:hypothetical protein